MARDKEQVLKRIQALLRLGESANEHEAALAASKAQELMLQYNLGIEDLKDDDLGPEPFGIEEYWLHTLYVTAPTIASDMQWKRLLLSGIAQCLFCEVIGYHELDGHHSIVGQPSNVRVVKYLYEYLSKEIVRLSDIAWRASDASISSGISEIDRLRYLSWIVSFKLGATQAVYERLEEQYRRTTHTSESSSALVLDIEARRDQAVRDNFGDIPIEDPDVHVQAGAFGAGREAGLNIPINSGLPADHADRIDRQLPG